MQWYYTVQGQRQGPVEDAGLENLVRQGVIRDDTYVWHEGMAEWQLYGAVKPKPAPAPAPPPAAPPPKPVEYAASPESRTYSPPAPAPKPAPASKPAVAGTESGIFFYYPVLRALARGTVIRTCVIWGLKIGAVAAALGGLLSALGIFSAAQGSGASGMLGAILAALVLLAASLCVAQVLWYRAGSVAALGDAEYTLIPIAGILFRAAGESGATACAGIGVAACLFLWLSPAGGGGFGSLPIPVGLPVSTGFVGGIVALLYLALIGFLSLISGYLAAEWIVVLVDIAESIHKIRRVAEAVKTDG